MKKQIPLCRRMRKLTVYLLAAMVGAGSISCAWAMREGSSEILLQAFHWRAKNADQHGAWYDLIASKAQDIAEAGITLVWFPPPSKTMRSDLDEFGDWASANGYVPMDYYDLGEYRQWVQDGWPPNAMDGKWYQHAGSETLWGSRSELQNAIAILHGKGVKVIADIVLNHRGPRQLNRCGEAISWGDDLGRIESGRMVWGHYNDCDPQEIINGDGGAGGNDDGESGFSPNVAHQNLVVKSQLKEWLSWLKNPIGFDGWRYDYVKGFAPNNIRAYNDHTQPFWSVGEFWDYDPNHIIGWINATHSDKARKSTAFDFPTKKILTDHFGSHQYSVLASLPGLMGRWPAKAVTFLDNHDTHPPHHNPYPFPDNRLLEGYAYILTHPGTPTIYWQHFYDKSPTIHDKIKELAQIRRQEGITNTSTVRILRAEQDLYAAEIDGNIVTKIGPKGWQPADAGLSGYSLRAEYGDYKIWTRRRLESTTTFRLQKDVGWGNFISVRGSLPQLGNWGPGPHCTWTAGNVWECQVMTIPAGQPFQWKALRNDSQWECDIPGDCSPNRCGQGGETITVVPCGF